MTNREFSFYTKPVYFYTKEVGVLHICHSLMISPSPLMHTPLLGRSGKSLPADDLPRFPLLYSVLPYVKMVTTCKCAVIR